LGIDPRREGYPAGQAVGAITSIVPAGDIVRSIVEEAQRVIDVLSVI
jgi:NAD(P)H-dependent flavin oxidoreductase YrpB (nitropropane dioxygenase family)